LNQQFLGPAILPILSPVSKVCLFLRRHAVSISAVLLTAELSRKQERYSKCRVEILMVKLEWLRKRCSLRNSSKNHLV
jgi:hypothetical protein